MVSQIYAKIVWKTTLIPVQTHPEFAHSLMQLSLYPWDITCPWWLFDQ
jgi:hypothetical protein